MAKYSTKNQWVQVISQKMIKATWTLRSSSAMIHNLGIEEDHQRMFCHKVSKILAVDINFLDLERIVEATSVRTPDQRNTTSRITTKATQ